MSIGEYKEQNRGDAFLRSIKSAEEPDSEAFDLLNWNDMPIYYKKLSSGKISLYRSKAKVTAAGTIKVGEFHLYVEDLEHYGYALLEIEDIASMELALNRAIKDLMSEQRQDKVYFNYHTDESSFKIKTNSLQQQVVFKIVHEDREVSNKLDLRESIYLAKILNIAFMEAYIEATEIRKQLWENAKPVKAKPQNKYGGMEYV